MNSQIFQAGSSLAAASADPDQRRSFFSQIVFQIGVSIDVPVEKICVLADFHDVVDDLLNVGDVSLSD